MDVLIDTEELAGAEGTLLFDCRSALGNPRWGAQRYAEGHIAGAQWLSLESDLSGPTTPTSGRHPLPDRTALRVRFGQLGLLPDGHVVAYDDAGGAFAARTWWLLRWLGHANVQVLDGGLAAWLESGRALTQYSAPPAPRDALPERQALTRLRTADEVSKAAEAVILDARDRARFRGTLEPIDGRAGHIPGALSAPFAELLDASGRFARPDQIRTHLSERLSQATESIAYCGSGVTACHLIAACVHAGLPEPALYPGSFSEWIRDPARPVAIGD